MLNKVTIFKILYNKLVIMFIIIQTNIQKYFFNENSLYPNIKKKYGQCIEGCFKRNNKK